MTVSQNMVLTPLTTATGTLMRTVADQIRRLNPNVTPFLKLVKTSKVDDMGTASYSSGLINKEATPTMKFEWFTYTPVSLFYTATGGGSTALVLADTSAFRTRDIVTNMSTGLFQVGIVTTVTDGNNLVIQSVGTGANTWTASANDVIAMSCRTMEEGTSDITPLTKEPDNNYNFVFPFRYVVSIADTAINSPHYTEKPLERYMKDNMTFTLANLENALLLGQQAVTNNTTTCSIGGVSYAMYTTRGLLNYAANVIDGTGMTFDKWTTTIISKLPNILNPENTLIALMGRNSYGLFQSWANQKLIYMQSGKQDEFGIVVEKFMCGPFTILPVMHNTFNYGSLANTLCIFPPEDVDYMYKTDMDIQPKNDLQLPATWGTTRGLQGVVGLRSMSGGQAISLITNFGN